MDDLPLWSNSQVLNYIDKYAITFYELQNLFTFRRRNERLLATYFFNNSHSVSPDLQIKVDRTILNNPTQCTLANNILLGSFLFKLLENETFITYCGVKSRRSIDFVFNKPCCSYSKIIPKQAA